MSNSEASQSPGAPGVGSHPDGLDRIRRLAKQAERRIRIRNALRVAVDALCAALALATVDVALRRIGILGARPSRAVLAFCAAGVLGAAAVAWARRLPEWSGAHALDRFHRLHDRFASALAFAEQTPERRTAFMRAAIDDAVTASPVARPRMAVPIEVPRHLLASASLAAMLVGVALFPVHRPAPVAHLATIEPVEMASDDLDDVKDFIKQIDPRVSNDDAKATIEEFNRLIDDIANRRLDRTEAFRRMGALEEKLLTGSEADKRALEEQVDRIAAELKRADLTKPAGDALARHDLERARTAMRELAKKTRDGQVAPIDKSKLDEMRAALKKAAAGAEERKHLADKRRQELADDILKLKQATADGGSDEERSLLDKKQRELERLDRDLDAHEDARRKLDRLDRELAQAAEDLMKDLGASADDLDQGAEDIQRMQQQEMTEQQKEQLRQKLQELRELVRQQGQGGKGQIVRLKRFARMARGQGSSQGQCGGSQGPGSEQGGGSKGGGGEQEPSAGGGSQETNGQGGSGGPGQNGETWVLGPHGEKLLMLSKGQGTSGQGELPGGGEEPGGGSGKKWGDGHDPNVQGGGTNPKMGTEDTQVQGADTGQGPARSQVILGAAERGFASRNYKRVYTEYHEVAEQSLAKDEIPGGFRFYVKRYFQLIRPREGP